LVDQQHRRVSIEGEVAGGHLDVQPLCGAVTELLAFHQP
jgi:hypothetical protein